jgi:hypothetical protein
MLPLDLPKTTTANLQRDRKKACATAASLAARQRRRA